MMTPLNDWALEMRARGLARRTIDERLGLARRFIGAYGIAYSATDIQVFLAEDWGASTRQTYWTHLRALSAYLAAAEIHERDATAGLRPPRRAAGVPRPIPAGSLGDVIAACTRADQRDMILLGALAGLRIHEIARVHTADIDTIGETMVVNGKGGRVAMLPLHTDLALVARRRAAAPGYWFPSPTRPGAVSAHHVGRLITAALQGAGLNGFTPHALRHFFGTSVLDATGNLRVAQELLRHESVASTQIYTRVTSEQQRAALAGIRVA